MGGSKSTSCNKVSKQIWLFCIKNKIWLACSRIPGKQNVEQILNRGSLHASHILFLMQNNQICLLTLLHEVDLLPPILVM
jgi:hypothetical protein